MRAIDTESLASSTNLARLRILLIVSVGYVLLSLFPGRFVLLSGLLSVDLAEGIPLAAALVFGPVGALGAMLGYVLSTGINGAISMVTVFDSLGHLLLGLAGYEVWKRFGSTPPTLSSVRDFGVFALSALVGVITATAVVGWGYAVSSEFSFFISSILELPGLLVATVGIGVPSLLVAPKLRESSVFGKTLTAADGKSMIPALLLVVFVGWYLTGTAMSIGYNLFDVISPRGFRIRGLGFLLWFDNNVILGKNGTNIQSVVGSMVVVSMVVFYYKNMGELE